MAAVDALLLPPFNLVRCDDPRLRVQWPALAALGSASVAATLGDGSDDVARVFGDIAEELTSWATRLATAPLDEVADSLLRALQQLRPTMTFIAGLPPPPVRRRGRLAPQLRPELHRALARRLGLLGDPPATLEVCAAEAGVTRERIRQLALQVQSVPRGRLWAPTLDAALAQDPATGNHDDGYPTLLHRRGLALRPWHPEAVNALAQMCGRQERVTAGHNTPT
jgi:hypothetical protein